MRVVDIQKAKARWPKLVEEVSKGETVVIAKAGQPLVKLTPLNAPAAGQIKRLGFMAGQITVPDDFNTMGSCNIEQMFHGGVFLMGL